jgi:hypothetical protein
MTTTKTVLNDEQIATVFEALLGYPPRTADLAVLRIVGGLTVTGLAAYIHDHWLGSPDEPTLEQVAVAVRDCLNEDER